MYRSRLCAAASVVLLSSAFAATQAWAGQVISAVGVDVASQSQAVPFDLASTTAGGAVSYSDSNYTMKATTDFGVNRIYNQAGSASALDVGYSYASSVWGQTFTAQGTGTVNLKFTFTIDGSVDYGTSTNTRSFNYLVSALAGQWDLSSQWGYDEITATKPVQTLEVAFGAQRTFSGNWAVSLINDARAYQYHGATADGNYTVDRVVIKNDQNYFVQSTLTNLLNGQVTNTVNNPTTLNNFPILAHAALCTGYSNELLYDGCAPGDYPPTTLTLDFNLAAGTSFTLFSSLMSMTAENGTVDFYNTVRLKDIVATGGTLSSDNAQFVQHADGSFGFSSADEVSGVPEPASWGLMILGFGGVGGAMRRHRRVAIRFA